MVKVKILSGGYGLSYTYQTKKGTKRGTKLILRGQTAELPEEDAQRLIALGQAVQIAEQPEEMEPDGDQEASTDSHGDDTPEPDKEQETEANAPAADGDNVEPEDDEVEPEPEPEPEEDEVELSTLSVQQLKEICTDAGIDIKGLNSKAKLIAAYEAKALPELGAEDPV
jgi:hypothetical protein